MDPQRRDELDYLAGRIASESAFQADQRKRSEAQAAMWEHSARIESEKRWRERKHLSPEQRRRHDDLETAVDDLRRSKKAMDNTESRLRRAVRVFYCWVAALVLTVAGFVMTVIKVLSEIEAHVPEHVHDESGWSLGLVLLVPVFIAAILFSMYASIRAGWDWWTTCRSLASSKFCVPRLRREAARLYAEADFEVAYSLADKLDELKLR